MRLLLRDLRYGVRAARNSPWHLLSIIGVLGIGIGLTTVAFAIADGVLFKPLPFAQASGLYLLRPGATTAPVPQPPPASWRDVEAWTRAVPDLQVTVISHGSSTMGSAVDARFFDVMGTQPLIGGFSEADSEWFADFMRTRQRVRPVLLSYRRWLNDYGGDPTVVGKTIIHTNREKFVSGVRIAGVLPPDFVFPLDAGEAQPDAIGVIPRELQRGTGRNYHLIARLGPGDSVAELGGRLTAAASNLPREVPPAGHLSAELNQRIPFDHVQLVPLAEHLARHERPAMALVLTASGLLLLLAAVNVAGLAAARNVERRRSLQIRTALGAGPGALARELFAELLIPAVAAAGLALLIARPLLFWTLELLPSTVTLLKSPALDARVFVVAALTTIATSMVVTLWPARVAARLGATAQFESTDGATGPGRRAARPLIVLQVAAGFVLLIAGGLTVTSLAAAWRNDAGFRRDHVLLLELSVNQSSSSSETREKLEAVPQLLESVEGVDAVAYSTIQSLFARRSVPFSNVVPEGWIGDLTGVTSRQVSANYFAVMGLPLIDGRRPSPGEWENPRIAIVSETASRTLWPDRSAIGRTLVQRGSRPQPPLTVIGVVADARYAGLDLEPGGDIYLPAPMGPGRYGLYFHVRTTRPAATVLGPAVAALGGRGYLLEQATTHADALFASVKHRALPAWLFGTMGIGALIVLATGILGILGMSAARRTREVGIRLALGATRARVVRLLVIEQLPSVVFGLALGALVSAWAVRLIESQLYGVSAFEPAVWIGVALGLGAVALLATLAPALRAARGDVVQALRAE
jgi:predicted permease